MSTTNRIYPTTLPANIRADVERILSSLPAPTTTGPLTGRDVDLYGRISDDRKRAGAEGRNAVEQISDAARAAVRLGADPERLSAYVENDRSAYKRARVSVTMFGETFDAERVDRPVWRALLADVRKHAGRGVVGLDLDRLARDPQDAEDAITTATMKGALWFEVTGGAMELDTPDGQLRVRMKAMIANKSSSDTARRLKRAHERRVSEKVPNWNRRPFGHHVVRDERGKAIRAELVPGEAAEIVDAAQRVLRGAMASEIARDWHDRGVRTTTGGSWLGKEDRIYLTGAGKNRAPGAGVQVAQLLRQARLAGLLAHKGEIIGPSDFIPAILERPLWEAVVAKLDSQGHARQGLRRGYAGGGGRLTELLTGADSPARCGVCGEVLTVLRTTSNGEPRYKCVRSCVSISVEATDREVMERAAMAAGLAGVSILPGADAVDAAPLKAQEAKLTAELDGWRADVLAHVITRETAVPLISGLERQLAQVRADIAKAEGQAAVRPTDIRRVQQGWAGMDLGEKRAIVGRLYSSIKVNPRGKDRKLDPGFRLTTRFANWLPADSPAASVDIQGMSGVADVTGSAVVGHWLVDGELIPGR